MADDEEWGRGVWTAATPAVRVVVGVAARDHRSSTPGDAVDDAAACLGEAHVRDDRAGRVAVPVPAVEDGAVAEPATGARISAGDEAVDGGGQGAEDLGHGVHLCSRSPDAQNTGVLSQVWLVSWLGCIRGSLWGGAPFHGQTPVKRSRGQDTAAGDLASDLLFLGGAEGI